uniref:RING-type domain-containing protein n=1 Tax=Gadus morhua TaxID=8049 RepID=A0A8C5BE01_GADMO
FCFQIPKRRKATCPQCSGCSAKNSRTANTRSASCNPNTSRDSNSSGDTISSDSREEDVVDLTCEGTEPAAVVDLTNNDSVVVSPEGTEGTAESYVVSSDEEEEDARTLLNADLLSTLQASSQARATPGTISCPVCMDSYTEIVDTGRLVVSTKCGHVFCSQCIRDSLAHSHTCPTCRKKLTPQQYHPIYI